MSVKLRTVNPVGWACGVEVRVNLIRTARLRSVLTVIKTRTGTARPEAHPTRIRQVVAFRTSRPEAHPTAIKSLA